MCNWIARAERNRRPGIKLVFVYVFISLESLLLSASPCLSLSRFLLVVSSRCATIQHRADIPGMFSLLSSFAHCCIPRDVVAPRFETVESLPDSFPRKQRAFYAKSSELRGCPLKNIYARARTHKSVLSKD